MGTSLRKVLVDVPDFVREELWGDLRLVWVGLIGLYEG
jgi:hypothetical protein